MQTPHLIYFADAMCSWCYGFSPVIADIRKTFGRTLPIQLIMGGLRPGTEEPMTDKAKADLAGHWTHVTEASG
ncbi:MAG: DsbA family protein, partial [Phenylobacterium sp.]|nr:DsbA family protein [Phenylobacterium sp.]